MTKQNTKFSNSPKRRRFLANSARAVCGVGMVGFGLVHFAKEARSLPVDAIRPPGAGDESDFLSACVRCGLCVNDCPYPTLSLAKIEDDLPVGTPYFVARDYPCEMCDDIPCVAACPTGALNKNLTDIDNARMGLAVLIDEETCLNLNGLRCDVCYRVCPEQHVLSPALKGAKQDASPIINAGACTNCGRCIDVCALSVFEFGSRFNGPIAAPRQPAAIQKLKKVA